MADALPPGIAKQAESCCARRRAFVASQTGGAEQTRRARIMADIMARTLPVLVNRSGGTAAALGGRLRETVEAAFAAAGQAIDLELVDGPDMAEAVQRHAGAPRVVVGGGDGTLGAAAAALATAPGALAILPLGTRNHLARQLGIPLDLAEAARVAVTGQRRRIDLGAAGERVFVNNASFGIYTRFVRQRDRRGGPKWLSALPATWHVLRHMRAQHFELTIDGAPRAIRTPLLFVGNNEYSVAPGHLGERETMQDGQLSLYAVHARKAHQLLAFALRALVGLGRPERDFLAYASAGEVVIEGQGWIEGAFDGELEWVELPLRLRTMPGALGVVTPRETAATERNLFRIHDSRAH
jgi:diacylglycerol kinase family enzyme